MKRFVDYFAYLEEEYRIKKLQFLVDQTSYILAHRILSLQQAEERIRWVREEAQKLFPDKMATYDLVYQTRLDRIFSEQYSSHK